MSEKLTAKQAAEQLLYKPEYAADKSADVKEKAAAFAEGYKAFLNAAKTEREAAAASEKLLLEAGYEKFEPKKTYAPGQKIYFVQEHKAVVAATIGRKSFEEGFRLVIAHIDSPRLDLRPNPLYEANHLSYFKTHYYGGIRKYQWGTMPLAIHGVFTRADGSSVSFAVGEDENDPVFCITDLLPHLGAEQNDRKLSEGIKAEELNVLIGSDAVEDADIKEAVKLNTLMLLHESTASPSGTSPALRSRWCPPIRPGTWALTAPWWAATVTMTGWTHTPPLWPRSRRKILCTPPSAC